MKNLKELIEKRNMLLEKITELKGIASKRAITEEENSELDNILKEVRELDNRIKVLELEERDIVEVSVDDLPVDTELREFLKNPEIALRNFGSGAGKVFKASEQGAIIPTTLSNKIIEKALEISDILPRVTRYSITGELVIPKFDRSTITTAFYDEFVEVVESNAGFTSVKITANRVSNLLVISKKLINNVNFDIEAYLINQLATAFRDFLEKALIQGDTNKFDSLFTADAERTLTLAKKDTWTIDELIDLQIVIPTVYQSKAVFVMNKKVLTTLRKLKDNTGQYYVLPDVTRGFGYMLLGTPILTSDFAPLDKIFYGDLECYSLGVASEMNMQVLREKYATQYAIGCVTDGEFGGVITDSQGIAILKNKA